MIHGSRPVTPSEGARPDAWDLEVYILMTGCLVMMVLAVGVSASLTALARALGRRLRILDHPDGVRKLHERPVARTGGLAVYAALVGVVGMVALAGEWQGPGFVSMSVLFLGALGVLLIGLWDDIAGARARWKLLLAALVSVAVWAAGWRIDVVANPFGRAIEVGYLSAPLTVLWLLACISAMNFIDGLDGLGFSTFGHTSLCKN